MFDIGRRVSSKGKSALVLGLLAATFAMSAHAQNKPILFEGFYRIGIESSGLAPPAGQCLFRGSNGDFERYLSPAGGPSRWCGFSTRSEYLQNEQGVFQIRFVTYTPGPPGEPRQDLYVISQGDGDDACMIANPDGTTGVADCAQAMQASNGLWYVNSYVLVGETRFTAIRSGADDRCLIFASDGQDLRPSLHRWTHDPSDQLYCGLGVDDLMETGQGLFTFIQVAPPN